MSLNVQRSIAASLDTHPWKSLNSNATEPLMVVYLELSHTILWGIQTGARRHLSRIKTLFKACGMKDKREERHL